MKEEMEHLTECNRRIGREVSIHIRSRLRTLCMLNLSQSATSRLCTKHLPIMISPFTLERYSRAIAVATMLPMS